MNILAEIRRRFQRAIVDLVTADEWPKLADMIAPAQDARFGDYQVNLAMPLGKKLGRPPRDVAAEIKARVEIADMCHEPLIAGPGFINLRLRDDWLAAHAAEALASDRLAVEQAKEALSIVIDYSAPNVAKPMHVGHIRSTVIGDSLYRTLKFLGYRVVGDNHIGDWGTQFGMILYGYRNFRDEAAYRARPVDELGRLYRLVSQLVGYFEAKDEAARLRAQIDRDAAALAREQAAAEMLAAPDEKKKAAKNLKKLEGSLATRREELSEVEKKISAVETSPQLSALVKEHASIGAAVLEETARLHAGDAESLRLWREFMPACLETMNDIYKRLGVTFDVTLGESFYHDRLAGVVDDLLAKKIAATSDGAVVVFVKGIDVPMIVRKKDGAFLYATTDLATIQYRAERWSPSAMLYVVDHRQSLHFEQLFAVARKWGYDKVDFQHVPFGTVLGDDGRPFKTRSGDTVGLMGLLDEAVRRAYEIVSTNDDAKRDGPELSADERQAVAERVGIAALKYADLSQNRTSDYVFSYDKMLAMNGNTATYMQYAYARVRSIFRKAGVDAVAVRSRGTEIRLESDTERALALANLRFSEALDAVVADYRPNQLTTYLFDLANAFSTFFEKCPVLKAENDAVRDSRLRLCDLTARTLKQGLELLGIEVVEKM